jgi:hypothetical protein
LFPWFRGDAGFSIARDARDSRAIHAQLQHHMKNDDQKSIALNLTRAEKNDGPPLGEVIDEALRVSFGNSTGGFLTRASARLWLARRAVRAVCEMIIREGGLVMPLTLNQSGNGCHLSANLFGGGTPKPIVPIGAPSHTSADRFRHARN